MNNLNHISESLETIFLGLKYGTVMEKIRIREINIPDPQHCVVGSL